MSKAPMPGVHSSEQTLPIYANQVTMHILLPDLSTLAAEIGICEFELSRYVLRADRYAPSPMLQQIRLWISGNVLSRLPLSDACKCWRRGTTDANEKWPHKKRRFIYSTEIADYFAAISFRRITSVFTNLEYAEPVANALARLCTNRGALPPDAPTSAGLANIVCRRLDRRLSVLAKRNNWAYTRCEAAITISGDSNFADSALIEKMVIAEDFQIDSTKTRLYTRSNQQIITGKAVDHRQQAAPRSKTRKMQASGARGLHTGTLPE